jgi:hypothetical protein
MSTTRRRKWWKEHWVADHYAVLKSPKLLEGQMEHRGYTCAQLADAASYERIRNGARRGVSRQMISYLKNGRLKSCEPDLAFAIEKVLDVPAHMLFDVLPKSRDTRQTVKGRAA